MSTTDLENYFADLSRIIFTQISADEVLLLNLESENSDFVRLNQNKIRQAGNVSQQQLHLNLIANQRQTKAKLNLSGNAQVDQENTKHFIKQMRDQIQYLPEDPYINYATQIHNSSHINLNKLPESAQAIDEIIANATGLDLVGIWGSGEISSGFANSLGQFNWHQNYNFNFDWSIYHHSDKAIKQSYAGFNWETEKFLRKIEHARETLPLLAKTAKTVDPGQYRVFLTSNAVLELMQLLSWGGFGLKNHRTLQTPLLKMIQDGVKLSPKVSIYENQAQSLDSNITDSGFVKPENVALIEKGEYINCLADSRSAKEYGETPNCSDESPQALHLDAGTLKSNAANNEDVFKAIDNGVYISNLWYCNYSDRNNCRITGMTRFACLWVENGKPVAPLSVMRFDESILHMFGDKLIDLTIEREHILDNGSYEKRSTGSAMLPGALIQDFNFTL